MDRLIAMERVNEDQVEKVLLKKRQDDLILSDEQHDALADAIPVQVVPEDGERVVPARVLIAAMPVDGAHEGSGGGQRDGRAAELGSDLENALMLSELGESLALALGDKAADLFGKDHSARQSGLKSFVQWYGPPQTLVSPTCWTSEGTW